MPTIPKHPVTRPRQSQTSTHRGKFLAGVILHGLLIAAFLAVPVRSHAADEAPGNADLAARKSWLVKFVERCGPATVNFLARELGEPGKGGVYTRWGSGTIIHPDGYIITNDHVAKSDIMQAEVTLQDGRTFPYRVIARSLDEDLALVKIDAGAPLPTIKVGRSHDLMLGETAVIIGNPAGFKHTVAQGIISGLHRDGYDTIQVNAGITQGVSGAAVLNVLGEMVGIVRSKHEEGIGFAIPVDALRRQLPAMLVPEYRYNFTLGLEVDTLGAEAVVAKVTAGSPAETAKVQPGDVIRAVGGMKVGTGLDFQLALVGRKGGEVLPLTLGRAGGEVKVEVTLGKVALMPGVEAGETVNGLTYAAFQGQWTTIPDFTSLSPVASGTTDKFSLGAYPAGTEHFALKFTGYIRVPTDGAYIFYTQSDDGSMLFIGDRLVVNNDGAHGPIKRGGSIPLQAGLHPITVTYLQGAGDKTLTVSYEGPGINLKPIPATELFMKKPGGK